MYAWMALVTARSSSWRPLAVALIRPHVPDTELQEILTFLANSADGHVAAMYGSASRTPITTTKDAMSGRRLLEGPPRSK